MLYSHYALAQNDFTFKLDEHDPTVDVPCKSKKIKKKRTAKWNYLSLNVGPSINKVTKQIKFKGISKGIKYGVKYADWIAIEYGILFFSSKHISDPVQYVKGVSGFDYGEEISYRSNFIDISTTFKIRLRKLTEFSSVYINTGIVNSFVSNNQIVAIKPASDQPFSIDVHTTYWSLGFGAECQIFNKLNVSIEPAVRYSMNHLIGNSSLIGYTSQLGITGSISYGF
ncbi:hypothetical protein JYT59_00965 [Sphingobacteriaceae bacterium AH-315-L07]|nr:hypothetical protein [Sphingobacteriaceae bacterium AH-315-L07]